MKELDESDWATLQSISKLASIAEERVDVARDRFANPQGQATSPLTLLVGCAEGGINLLVKKGLGEEAEAALNAAGSNGLLSVGANPPNSNSMGGSCPFFKFKKHAGLSMLIVRNESINPALAAKISSFGLADQAVLVTRWSQPLPSSERTFLASLSELAASIRVLVVTLPGEEPQPNEVTEVREFIKTVLKENGLGTDRGAEVDFWLTSGDAPFSITNLVEYLVPQPGKCQSGRMGAARAAFGALLREIAEKTETSSAPKALPIAEKDIQDIEEDLKRYLGGVKQSTQQRLANSSDANISQVRQQVIDQVKTWKRHDNAPGMWLKYVETLRPGTAIGLQSAIEQSLSKLDLEATTITRKSSGTGHVIRRGIPIEKVVRGLICGAALYGILTMTLPDGLPGRSLLLTVGLMLGTIGGYAINLEKSNSTTEVHESIQEISNWSEFEWEVLEWLRNHLSLTEYSVKERCRSLATKTEIPWK